MKNITEVKDLCTGCGTCAGLCPQNIIKMEIDQKKGTYVPIIKGECNECMICIKVCPGIAVNFEELNEFVFQEKPKDIILGTYKNIYVGHSLNEKLRSESSSGGVVLQLLLSLLDGKIIDGALVTRMSKNDPLKPEAFIATTKDELIDAIGSKYCPVPANVALNEILNSNFKKFAVVGLPCHIHGLRKAERLKKELKEKIVLHIGLFCSYGITFLATQYLLYKLGIAEEEVKEMVYRTGDFPPGYMIIKCMNGSTKKVSHVKFWNLVFNHLIFCSSKRCMACRDQTCELADISIGSGWFPYLQYNLKNHSLIITRSEFADRMIKRLNGSEMKMLRVEGKNGLKRLQEMEKFKRDFLKPNTGILKLFGNKVPSYGVSSSKEKRISTGMYVWSLVRYIKTELSTKKYLWPIFKFFQNLDK